MSYGLRTGEVCGAFIRGWLNVVHDASTSTHSGRALVGCLHYYTNARRLATRQSGSNGPIMVVMDEVGPPAPEEAEVAIVGMGPAGLSVACRLTKQPGVGRVVAFEKNAEVGGTWSVNTYPGAACDVPAHLYSLSFAHDFDWSRNFATQSGTFRVACVACMPGA